MISGSNLEQKLLSAADLDIEPGPLIRLEDVTRIFPGPPAVNALRGIDLAVDPGEYLAIADLVERKFAE